VGERLLAQVRKRCDSTRVLGSVLALPFGDRSFDVVASGFVVERYTGFNVLPLFRPAFEPLLCYADHRAGAKLPDGFVNFALRARRTHPEPGLLRAHTMDLG